ncbi:MATE family efflux transporter [Inconstantimicrobium mannanitabidum]|uniref:MATE family efflux transporter n=1 Tax=Inconstantimicrobium mannanitabidum TaxID=1604901 RepID=A0ACB5RBQ0_9CLOT|nr:MATE family efflux transporter [Clostridium sp. TW13]GKX66663.1 MATE family efflux transporter [Clostridium sp. TW13]
MKDLTKGSPIKLIIAFAIPILIGNIFQQLYNLIDTVIVGQTLSVKALAAVGATAPIVSLIIGFAIGMTNGFAVIVARYFGAKDYEKMRQAVAGTIVLGLATSAVLTVSSLLGIKSLLNLLDTPKDIMDNALLFIRIILLGMTFSMLYNMLAGILRALGDTKNPLYFLIISTVVNIILDFLFICTFRMGIEGAAYATVLSQLLSTVLCFRYILKNYPILRLKRRHFKFKRSLIVELFSTGISMGLMLSVVASGTVILQSSINGFGTATIAAHTAARKISEMFMLPFGTLSVTAATFSSQNYGAKKPDRIKKGLKQTILVSWIWATVCIIISYTFMPIIISGITGTSQIEIIQTATKYLRIDTPFYYVLGILLILRSTLQGIGQKVIPIIASFFELGGKIVAVSYLAPTMGYFGICITEPIIWVVCTAFLLISCIGISKKISLISAQS